MTRHGIHQQQILSYGAMGFPWLPSILVGRGGKLVIEVDRHDVDGVH